MLKAQAVPKPSLTPILPPGDCWPRFRLLPVLVTSAWTEGHPCGARVCPACPPALCLCSSLGCSGRTSVPAPRVPGANHARSKAQTPACFCSVKASPSAVPCPELNPHTGGAESSQPSHRWSVTWLCTGRVRGCLQGCPLSACLGLGNSSCSQDSLRLLAPGHRATPAWGPSALGSSTAPHQHWELSPGPHPRAWQEQPGERIHQQPCPGRGPACHQRGDPPTGSFAQRAQDPSAGWRPPQ